jgi:hypothetical protein
MSLYPEGFETIEVIRTNYNEEEQLKVYLQAIWESLYDTNINSPAHKGEMIDILIEFNREYIKKAPILELKIDGKHIYPWDLRQQDFNERSPWWPRGVKIITAALNLQLVDPKIKDKEELFKGATEIPSTLKGMYEEAKGLAIKVQPTPATYKT